MSDKWNKKQCNELCCNSKHKITTALCFAYLSYFYWAENDQYVFLKWKLKRSNASGSRFGNSTLWRNHHFMGSFHRAIPTFKQVLKAWWLHLSGAFYISEEVNSGLKKFDCWTTICILAKCVHIADRQKSKNSMGKEV